MQLLHLLLTMLVGLGFLIQAVFWLLFFFVVKVRIADRALVVDEASRFSFLVRRWPHEEMRAYRRSLSSEERQQWLNRFLCNANFIGLVWMGLLFATLIAASIVAG